MTDKIIIYPTWQELYEYLAAKSVEMKEHERTAPNQLIKNYFEGRSHTYAEIILSILPNVQKEKSK